MEERGRPFHKRFDLLDKKVIQLRKDLGLLFVENQSMQYNFKLGI